MTKTNRFLNRLLVGLVGLVLLLGGLAVLATTIEWPWRDASRDIAGQSAGWVSGQVQQLAASVNLTPESVFAGICLVLGGIVVIVALSVLFSRGGGKSKTLSKRNSTSRLAGGVVLEAGMPAEVIKTALLARNDVVHVGSSAYTVRRNGVLVLRVQLRSGAAIGEVVAAAEASAKQLDTFLGEQPPIVLEIVEGARAKLSGDTRTAALAASSATTSTRPRTLTEDRSGSASGTGAGSAEPVVSGAVG